MTPARLRILELMPFEGDRTETARSGVYFKGPAFRAAQWLTQEGLARQVRDGVWVGGYFVRTDKGENVRVREDRKSSASRKAG